MATATSNIALVVLVQNLKSLELVKTNKTTIFYRNKAIRTKDECSRLKLL